MQYIYILQLIIKQQWKGPNSSQEGLANFKKSNKKIFHIFYIYIISNSFISNWIELIK